MNSRATPGLSAFALMILLCAIWGFQQITIKVAIEGVSPVLQAGIRSLAGLVLLTLWARWRGLPLLNNDGTLRMGLLAGFLFALEFIFIYVGLAHTTASRMIVFLYTAPCFTVLGLHWFVPGERLNWRHFSGIALAFAGLAVGFLGEGGTTANTLIGDFLGLLGALGWAATTILIRATGLSKISATKVLWYQLAISAVVMLPLSPLMGEAGIVSLNALTTPVLLALAYQGVQRLGVGQRLLVLHRRPCTTFRTASSTILPLLVRGMSPPAAPWPARGAAWCCRGWSGGCGSPVRRRARAPRAASRTAPRARRWGSAAASPGRSPATRRPRQLLDLAVDLGGADAHAAGVERGVRAAVDDHAAVRGDLAEVAVAPDVVEALEVGGVVLAAVGVVPEADRHHREGLGAHQLALLAAHRACRRRPTRRPPCPGRGTGSRRATPAAPGCRARSRR
jgi:drug/metabolite transporter (DMT)-like permease